MLKLKRVMGNAVRCRIDAEYMVSRYEIGVLQIHPDTASAAENGAAAADSCYEVCFGNRL